MKDNRAVREPFPERHAGNTSVRRNEAGGHDFMRSPSHVPESRIRKRREKSGRVFRRFAARAGIMAGIVAVCIASGLVSGTINQELAPDKERPAANEETEYVNCAQKLYVIDHDINYSQFRDWEKRGAYALIKVRNDNDEPVSGMMFIIVMDDGIAGNAETGDDYFKASGYVPPYSEGYMCSLVRMDAGAGTDQGEITPVDGYACAANDELAPFGKITRFDPESDSYDAEIVNRSGRDFMQETATVVAVNKKVSGLAGAWGAGELSADIKDGDTVRLKSAIVNPGFKDTKTADYQVFLVDN